MAMPDVEEESILKRYKRVTGNDPMSVIDVDYPQIIDLRYERWRKRILNTKLP